MACDLISRLFQRLWQQRRQRPRKKPRSTRLLFEILEDRLTPSTVTETFAPATPVTQLVNQSTNTFLGASFNQSASFGSIDSTLVGDFGAEATMNIAGQAGLNLNFTGTGGTISPSYNASLTQGFAEPTGFGQVVSFNPQNTNVAVNSGSLSTTSPSFGYGADLVAALNGSIGGQFAVFSTVGGSFSFGGSEDIPLFSVNQNNDGEVDLMGYPIVGASPGLGLGSTLQSLVGGVENALANLGLYLGISNDPPLRVKLTLSTPQNLTFEQDLELQLGVPQQVGPYTVPAKLQGYLASAGLDLGNLTEEAPSVALNSTAVGAGGVLSASGSGTIAQLSLQAGALAGSLLGLGVLGTTDSINLGPISVKFTPVSFLLQPTLTAQQSVSIQPTSRLTYTFTNAQGQSISPDVTLDGTDLGAQSSVTFTPGQDTVGVKFEGAPITVTPSWNFQENMTNEVDLDAALDATLTVGEISASIPGLGTFTAGPLYQQQFNFANGYLATLFNTTSTILNQTSTLPSFTIGGGNSFPLSTIVNTPGDNNTPGAVNPATGVPANNSLRDAILAANALASQSNTTIQLGAGVYILNIPAMGADGTTGNLLVTDPNLTIVGAGPGQTTIEAEFPTKQMDRLFHVSNGANLTLDGLTIEDGNSANSYTDPGEGGGILADAGTSLDIVDCIITGNTAPGTVKAGLTQVGNGAGGAILANGSLTITDSTISDNSAVGSGGGISVQDSTILLQDSTVSGNTVTGGYYQFFGTSYFVVAYGGGLDLENSTGTITSSTFADNEAVNTSYAEGGAVRIDNFNNSTNVLIDNSTLYGNQADNPSEGAGGAIFDYDLTAHLFLVNDTIASNTAGYAAGIVATYPQPIVLQNTIVADNTDYSGAADDMNGVVIASLGHNLIGSTGSGQLAAVAEHGLTINGDRITASGNGFDPTDLANVNPMLGPLASNGGPTQTLALLAGSPAIGHGSTTINVPGLITQLPATDQRGYSRTSGGGVDIGAVQYQYDLAVTGSETTVSSPSNTVTYTFTVTNNGPDAAANVTLTDPLPAHITSAIGVPPSGWNDSVSGGTVTFTDANPLTAGQSATFTLILGLVLSPPSPVNNTATVGPSAADTNSTNNQATLTVLNATVGVELQNAILLHFASPGPTYAAGAFSAAVNWGDGGTGTASVVADPNGGFDVLGAHTYTAVGNHAITVNVTGALASISGTVDVVVADAALTAGPLTPPAVILQQTLNQTVLYHFLDPDLSLTATAFNATVQWGDGNSNTSSDGTRSVSVVADAAGGFDVMGTHTFAGNIVGAVNSVQVVDSQGLVFNQGVLFHFTDGNPLATAADFTATVQWGDGASNTSANSSSAVVIVADATGGFDVVGSHAYTQNIRNGTFSVQVVDAAGAAVSASTNTFSVDYPLTAGTLSTPAVTSAGQSIAKALLFHFSDGDPQGQPSDFTATAVWGDGSSNSSSDGTGTVTIAPNAHGGFDVFGSHTFGDVLSGATYGVFIQDVSGAITGASTTSFSIVYPAVSATGKFAVTATKNTDSGAETVATFTDPVGAQSVSGYSASVNWGDGTPAGSGTITLNGATGVFTVQGHHLYATAGSYAVSVSITHGHSTAVNVSDTATVSVPAVDAIGTFNGTSQEGQSTGGQTVATFTDPAGADAPTAYSPSISWGDTTSSVGTVGFDTSAPFTFASHIAVGNGPTAAVLGDLDGTGTLDMVVANAADNDVEVFIGNGDGTFQSPAIYSLGAASPVGLALADLTGDGKLDIVTVNANNNTVSVLLNNGSGVFQPGQSLSTGASPSGLAVADLNGDNRLDIVTANRGDNTLSIFLGNGDGTFQPATTLATGANPVAVTAGDLNGNGRNDLVVTETGSNTVSVFMANGNGTFQPRQSFAVGSYPTDTVLAQLTNNGILDIVTANAGSDDVSVLLGNGDGTFQPAVNYATGSAPVAVLAVDAYGNGRQDIITANNGSNNVSVLAGNGDGTFQPVTNFALSAGASAPNSIATGDVNGAGVLDLVTANSLSNDVTVLLPPFAVTGTHTYTEATGAHPDVVSVTIQHDGITSAPVTGSATVTDAPLFAGALTPPSATVGIPFANVTVFHFSDVDPNATAGDYTAVVSLGDGNSVTLTGTSGSKGQIVADANGGFDVQLSYTYAIHGHVTFAVSVYDTSNGRAISDPSDSTASASTTFIVLNTPIITWSTPAAITYGTMLTAAQLDAKANVPGSFSYTPPLDTVLQAGTQMLSVAFTPTDTTDYASAAATVNLTVNRANLTVTANNQTVTYGQSLPAFTLGYKSLVNNDSPASLGGTLNISFTSNGHAVASPVNAGTYTVTPSGLTSTNYNISFVAGTLLINKAHLTVTANSVSKTVDAANPPLTAAFSGFAYGQTAATAGIIGTASLSTTATLKSPAGSYPIAVSLGTLKAANYDFPTFVPGTLTVDYSFNSLLPMLTVKSGMPLLFLIELTNSSASNLSASTLLANAATHNVSAASIPVTAVGIAAATAPNAILPAPPFGAANGKNRFTWTGGSYTYLLATTGLKPGAYWLYFTAGNDPLLHAVAFVVTA